jgi:hypothetical protein
MVKVQSRPQTSRPSLFRWSSELVVKTIVVRKSLGRMTVRVRISSLPNIKIGIDLIILQIKTGCG